MCHRKRHVYCSFNFDKCNEREATENVYERVTGKFLWNNEFKPEYIGLLQRPEITEKLTALNSKIPNCTERVEANAYLSEFSSILENVASPLFKATSNKTNTNSTERCVDEKKSNPWYNEQCIEKKHYFLRKLDKYRETKDDESRIGMVKARSEYKTILRKCRYEYDKNKTSRFINAKYKNAKMYWNLLKESAGVRTTNVPLSSFEQYFKAVNNPSDPFFAPDEDVLYFNERYETNEFAVMFEELNLPFSNADLVKAIRQLRTNKSAGPDKLINEFFINGTHVLCPTMLILFNKLFSMGYFPETWSDGYVIPLHKKGSINDVNNYRGITLLSTLGKLFTRLINNRLSDWAENYSVLIEAQAGFRPDMGTVDNIFVLHGLISHFLNRGKKLYCAFIDFTKAFDYVVREILWFKLIKLGLRGSILEIIKSMYENAKSRVKFCNEIGNEFFCSLGVRQGECLSPLLFSLYLNDIEEQFMVSGFEGLDLLKYVSTFHAFICRRYCDFR